MKNFLSKGIWGIILLGAITLSCNNEDEEATDSECYTCTGCTGQYAHLLNDREYCISGFDNKADWETNRSSMEQENGCTCE